MGDDTIGSVSGNYRKKASEAEPTREEREKPAPIFSQIDFPFFQNKLTEAFGTPDYHQFVRNNIINIDLSEFSNSLGHVQDAVGFKAPIRSNSAKTLDELGLSCTGLRGLLEVCP